MAYPPDKYAHVRLEGLTLKPDEPWFLLRGQDVLTPSLMEAYADALEQIGKFEMAADVRDHAEAIRDWQRAHPSAWFCWGCFHAHSSFKQPD